MQHHSRNVRGFAQRWVAHHVHIGETGDPESVAQSSAARAFDVGEDLQTRHDAEAGVECLDAGGVCLPAGWKLFGPEIWSA